MDVTVTAMVLVQLLEAVAHWWRLRSPGRRVSVRATLTVVVSAPERKGDDG